MLAVNGLDTQQLKKLGDYRCKLPISKTTSSKEAWWETDLGKKCRIDKINAWTRQAMMSSYWKVWVLVLPERCEDCSLEDAKAKAVFKHFLESKAFLPMEIPNLALRASSEVFGRCVRVQLEGTNSLELVQVEVFGQPLEVDLAWIRNRGQKQAHV